MATITIDLGTAAQTTRAISAICTANGYPDPANPAETQAAFAKRMMIAYIKNCVKQVEGDVARQAKLTDVDSTVNPT